MGRKPVANERRKQIIEALHQCLLEKPFHKISIKDIAQKAGLNHGALHYYFKNKEDLLLEYIDYTYNQFDRIFYERLENEFGKTAADMQTFHDKYRSLLHNLSFNEEYARIFTEIWAHALYNQKVMDKIKGMYRKWRERIFLEISQFVHSKTMAKRISLTIIALLEGMSLMAIFFDQKDLKYDIDFGKFLNTLNTTT